MSKYLNYKITPGMFMTMATNVLYKTLLEASRTDAKRLFNAVVDGKQTALMSVLMDDETEVRFDLGLDHSEFRGERINFKAFRASLQGLVAALGDTVRAEQEVPVFTEKTDGSILFGVTGLTQDEGQLNVMMLGANMRSPGRVLLKLQYLDPAQFVQNQAS